MNPRTKTKNLVLLLAYFYLSPGQTQKLHYAQAQGLPSWSSTSSSFDFYPYHPYKNHSEPSPPLSSQTGNLVYKDNSQPVVQQHQIQPESVMSPAYSPEYGYGNRNPYYNPSYNGPNYNNYPGNPYPPGVGGGGGGGSGNYPQSPPSGPHPQEGPGGTPYNPQQIFSKSISGDYCWDPLFPCDTANTILYCLNKRCTCPTGWTLAPGNLPLNTVWHPDARKCVSLIGSACHSSTDNEGLAGGNGYVYCQPGVKCQRHRQYPEVGTCGAAGLGMVLTSSVFIILRMFAMIWIL